MISISFYPGDIRRGLLDLDQGFFTSQPGGADSSYVVVSHVHYVTDIEPIHVHHEYYVKDPQKTFDDRLRTVVLQVHRTVLPLSQVLLKYFPHSWIGYDAESIDNEI